MTWAMEVTSEAMSMGWMAPPFPRPLWAGEFPYYMTICFRACAYSPAPLRRRTCRVLHDLDDLAHDLREIEVLRRIDAGDAGGFQLRFVLGRDDAADDDRHAP